MTKLLKFTVTNSVVGCPVCDTPMTLIKEYDPRVALMQHQGKVRCPHFWKQFRIDRLNGEGEEAFPNETESPEVQLQTRIQPPAGT